MLRRLIGSVILGGGLLAGMCIVGTMVVMAIEVFCRYVISSPTFWALEVSTYLLGATVAFGSPYTLRVGGHVAVELFHDLLPRSVQRLTDRLVMLIVLGFAIILIWQGIGEAHLVWRLGTFSLTPLAMPLVYPLSLIPIGGFLLAIQALELLIFPAYRPEPVAGDVLPLTSE